MFVAVTVCDEAVWPTVVATNVRPVRLNTTFATAVPVPVSVTVCVTPGRVKVAVRLPVAVGVKLIAMVQLAEGARVVVQVFAEVAKSTTLAPLRVGA
jgi:hypothetical protein